MVESALAKKLQIKSVEKAVVLNAPPGYIEQRGSGLQPKSVNSYFRFLTARS